MTDLQLTHGNLSLKLHGAGPRSLTLLHGLYCCKEFWEGYLPFLPSGFKAVVPDLLGHGDSEEGFSHSVWEHATALRELLDSLKVDRATLVGHSMGGILALAYALAHPDRVERLVLVMAPFTERGITFTLRGLLTPVLNRGAHTMNRLYFRSQVHASKGKGIWSRLLIPSRRAVVECAKGLRDFRRGGGLSHAADLSMPMLCLHSPGDPTLGRHQAEAGRAVLPQARHEVVQGIGHAWPIQDEDRFAGMINPFLSETQRA